jgi:hypothetical protein
MMHRSIMEDTQARYFEGTDILGADVVGVEVPPSPAVKAVVSVGIFAGVLLTAGILLREFARAMAER